MAEKQISFLTNPKWLPLQANLLFFITEMFASEQGKSPKNYELLTNNRYKSVEQNYMLD